MKIDIIRVIINKFFGGDVPKWSGTGRVSEEFTEQVAMQYYGFYSNIPPDSVGISLAVGDKALLIASDNADKRPKLNDGEVCLYTDTDTFILLDPNGKLQIKNNSGEELISLLSDTLSAIINIKTITALGPQPILNIASFIALKVQLDKFKK